MTGLSVVVACRDRAGLLADCLPAVQAALRPGDEVVVVDAGSRTGAVAQVALAAGARVVRSDRPGASAARNAGWRAARHEVVAFTDDDCRPAAGWGQAVVDALAEVDAVCGRVLAAGPGHLSVLADEQPRDYRWGEEPAGFGHGANLAVRRAALEAVGGWDERLGPGTAWPGAEDKDLLLRLLRSGRTAGYRPGPVVEHLQWRSHRQALRAEAGYGRGAGALATRDHGPGLGLLLRRSLAATARDARAGYRYGVLAGLLRTAGLLMGAASARLRLR